MMAELLDEAKAYAWATIRDKRSAEFDTLVQEYLAQREVTYDVAALLKPELIVGAVALEADVTPSGLYGFDRSRHLVIPRGVAMLLIYQLVPGMSYPRLAKLFSGRDHTTVLYACNRTRKALLDSDSTVSRLWRLVTVELGMGELVAA